MTKSELIEQLSAKEHEGWSHWMHYLFSKCEARFDGSVRIPSDLVARWQRQSTTDYEALGEQEKQSDRNRVALIVPIIEEYGRGEG